MRRRVVVTGAGVLTPVGNDVTKMWEAVCQGKSGVGPITKFDPTYHDTKIAGEIKNFDPLAHVNKKELRRLDDFIIYTLAAADMLMAETGFVASGELAERTGVIIGSAIGGVASIEEEKETLMNHGPGKISPFAIPAILGNLAAGQVSIRYNLKGPIECPAMACAAGAYGIGRAFHAIAYGYADAMVAGGVDAAVTPLSVAAFNAMRALSRRNEEPEKASRPFDQGRDGFVIAEGCGLVLLEELNQALNRGAKIYAEIVGFASTSDAYHMAAPPPGHEGAARCMREALADAGVGPDEVDYINAHGTSTPLNDLYELQAIKSVFGDHAPRLAISSTKSVMGHLLGGAGGVEAVITVKAICEDFVPPTINLDSPDPEVGDLDLVRNRGVKRDVRVAMSNSFGFGGANAVLVFKKYQD
ncbi:MAG TPA: beta-ketoacyl-ACP synthase II [Syntrophales bacterium]|nr:beta-ketoacyl-ACP synthase II [Syntrophales bacterium]HOL58735.1 beta-ketoacyl-ACP synthase II [Syntrophales bacterium]HPO34977.1 beta-ketoacyl-ACP synthase II [Syntrophales bacterium]